MPYNGDPVAIFIAVLVAVTVAYSWNGNRSCSVALLVSLVCGLLLDHYSNEPLQVVSLVVCGFIAIGKYNGYKLSRMPIKTNEANYLIFIIFNVRVAVWMLYLQGLFDGETFFISSMILLILELIIVRWSINGTRIHTTSNRVWDACRDYIFVCVSLFQNNIKRRN